jgi:hypothetical protein
LLTAVAKAKKDAPRGCSILELANDATGKTGWWLVVDEWYEKLRAEGGEDAVVAHVSQVLDSMGYAPTPALKVSAVLRGASSSPARTAEKHHAGQQMRDEAGRFRSSPWRKVVNSSSKIDTSSFAFFR